MTERLIIVASNKEPDNKHVIWLQGKTLKRWLRSGWETIGDTVGSGGIDSDNYFTKNEVLKLIPDISNKQDTLINGKNIKTINGHSLLGEGDLDLIKEHTLFSIVQGLPPIGDKNTIYLVPEKTGEGINTHIEYVYINNKWEELGRFKTTVDLSNYYTKEEIYNKEEVNNIINSIHIPEIDLSDFAKKEEVTSAIQEAVSSIPENPTKVSELENDSGYITRKDIEGINPTINTKYSSNIDDKSIKMTTSYGDFKSGTSVSELEGKSYDELFDGILFPTVVPTFTNPSASLSLSGYNSIQEVGSTAPTTSNFNTSYNAGAITLNDVKQANRAGSLDVGNSSLYIVKGTAYNTIPTEVTLGNMVYVYRAYYGQGPQPKDNKGNNYDSPLASGYVDSNKVTITGTYPWYATTTDGSLTNPLIKQPLIAWNDTVGSMTSNRFTLQPSGYINQVFKIPRKLRTLQMLNPVSGNMETISTSEFTESTEVLNINGVSLTYYVYTYNGNARGEVTLIIKF